MYVSCYRKSSEMTSHDDKCVDARKHVRFNTVRAKRASGNLVKRPSARASNAKITIPKVSLIR